MRALPPFLLSLCLACGGGTSSAGSAADAAADGGTCALAGQWSMTRVRCGANDVTNDVHGAGGIATMVLDISAGSSGCHIASTVTGSTCTERESIEVRSGDGGVFEATSASGITSCEPAACVFNANDAPCKIGDRADQASLTTAALAGSELLVTTHAPAGICGGSGVDTVVTYARK